MSLFGSLFSGVSGLSAQSKSMGMISDNIANVNTTAYKGTAAHFSSLVTGSQSPTSYSPGGVRSFAQTDVTRQGLIQSSDSATDTAISGGGFFVVNSEPLSNAVSAEQLYTRAGAFDPDFLGNLVTPSGFYLQGWALDANEEIIDINTLETVNIAIVNGLATATTNVEVGANLDADQAEYGNVPPYDATLAAAGSVNMAGGGVEPHFSRKIQVWDSLGRPQNLTMGFLKSAPNVWEVEVYATDPADVIAPNGLVTSGQVSFDGSGTPLANTVAAANATGSGCIGFRPEHDRFRFRHARRSGWPDPVREPDEHRLRPAERRRGGRAQRGEHQRGRLCRRRLHQWRGTPALSFADRHLRQSRCPRSALRQRVLADRCIG
ncbi:MAG: flagellar hook-basal body complex protein [Geminicoccaceae bacterium]